MGHHDTFFKRAFSVPEHAAAEIRSVLPPIVTSRMDLKTLRLLPASFVDSEMAHLAGNPEPPPVWWTPAKAR